MQSAFFGAGFCMVLGLVLLVRNKKPLGNHVMGVACLCVAAQLFYVYMDLADIRPPFYFLAHVYIVCVFLVGPSLYVVFSSMVDEEYTVRFAWPHFALPMVLLVGISVSYFMFPDAHRRLPLEFFRDGYLTWIALLQVAGLLSNVIYLAVILLKAGPLLRRESLRHERSSRIVVGFLFSTLGLHAIGLSAYLFQDIRFIYTGSIFTTLSVVVLFILLQREPELYMGLDLAMRRTYRNSRLEGLDTDDLVGKLKVAMEQKQLFMEEDLTAKSLAQALEIKPYQLSELLSSQLQTNFSRLVNGYRVEAAARMLLEHEGANILSVAFQVGFNSKATFNHAFKSIKGCSPREYLRRNRPHHKNSA